MRSIVLIGLWISALALPAGARASEFGDRYPTGSIKDHDRAVAALRDADTEQTRVEHDFKVRESECYKGVLVNRCRDQARRDKLTAEKEVRRVRVEAHDLQRHLDAENAARRRADAEKTAAPRDPKPPAEPRTGTTMSTEEAARNRAAYEQRVAEKQREAGSKELSAEERAENVRKYQEKLAEAAARAADSEAERQKREQRRAERLKQREAQEAQREKVRKQAEEAAKAAAK